MKNPKVSVIMSTYNDEKFLAQAIESILNQSFNDFEFIIINDFSKDDSLKIIKSYMKRDNRIKLINNAQNLGPAASRNSGIKKAMGDYIAIMDGDDISMPNRLELQYKFLESNDNISLVGSAFSLISETGSNLGKRSAPIKNEKIKKILPKTNCIHNPTVMFRNDKKTFYRSKFRYAQDYDLWLRLLNEGKSFYNLEVPLLKYRFNPNSITFSKRSKQRLFYNKAQDFYKQRSLNKIDKYEEFNPNEILGLDIENSRNPIFMREEIKSNFKINNFEKTREIYKKYWNEVKSVDKYIIYYGISFLNKNLVNLCRKVLWH